MIKLLFDIFVSFFGLVILSPFFLIISVIIVLDSKGGIFYKQTRVGLDNQDFGLLKFRSMKTGADKNSLLTVGGRDSRITKIGYYLRKYKLDELPQLINVLIGEMSFVGPRPEVRKYVELYSNEQLKVLSVKPGITDYASIEFANENDLLGDSANPEQLYVKQIMPKKLTLNMKYIEDESLGTDIKLILKTIKKIIG